MTARVKRERPPPGEVKPVPAEGYVQSARSKKLAKVLSGIDGFQLWSDVQPPLFLRTRLTSLNRALKCGGIPGGMVGALHGPSQGGKCLGIGTPVLKFDGSVVPVEDVREGDLLMGPDSSPRRVLSTTRGKGPLFLIKPRKRGEMAWVCNDVHVLTLRDRRTGEVRDIPLPEYLGMRRGRRGEFSQVRVPVDFPAADPLPINPYFLGVWFGDGEKTLKTFADGEEGLKGISICKNDPEIGELCKNVAEEFGLEYRGSVDPRTGARGHFIHGRKGAENPLTALMREVLGPNLDVVPEAYLRASREDRRRFLAGWLDTDGSPHRCGYEICQKRRSYADAICFLAHSLGYLTYLREKVVNGTVYYRITIRGADIHELPLRLARKRCSERVRFHGSASSSSFTAEPIGEGEYAGFELDGDGRFLLGDFTVTHNTLLLAEILHAAWATGGLGLFVDAECRAVDLKWFRAICGRLDEIAYFKPETYEKCIEKVEEFRRKFRTLKDAGDLPEGAFCVIGVDSINRLTPSTELEELLEGKVEARGYPLRAMLNSRWLDKLIPTLRRDEAFVFVQRESQKLDAQPGQKTYTVKGGKAVEYDSGWRFRITAATRVRVNDAKDGALAGEKHEVVVEKNSMGPHLEEVAYFYSATGAEKGTPCGLDLAREVREEAITRKLAEYKSGTGYLYRGEKVAESKAKFLEWLREDPRVEGRSARYEILAEELDASDASDE